MTDNTATANKASAAAVAEERSAITSRKRPLDDSKDTSPSTAPTFTITATQGDPDISSTATAKPPQQPPTKQAKVDYRPKVKPKRKTDPAVLEFRRLVQHCCKSDDLDTAMKSYESALAKGLLVEAQSFYNLLNLCDGLSDRGVHIGTPRRTNDDGSADDACAAAPGDSQPEIVKVSPRERREHAFRIKKHMESISLPLNEPAYTALVRILSKANDTENAELLLTEAEQCQQCKPKLRMYSALILAYCNNGDMTNAVNVWNRLHRISREVVVDRGSANSSEIIQLSEREYCSLIHCATRTCCDVVMERVLSEIAEDILIPSADTTNAIVSWFESPGATVDSDGKGDEISANIESLLPPRGEDLPTMGPVVCTSKSAMWEVSRSCSIDTSNATLTSGCLKDKKLKPVELSMKAWSDMMTMNESIVLEGSVEGHRSKFQGGRKGQKRMLKMKNAIEKRQHDWHLFKKYLANRIGPSYVDASVSATTRRPFDVVIDGANVGYYKQNFANSPKHVDYEQIDNAISHFTEQGKSVLMVLHERHFNRNLMPEWAAPIAKKWEEKGVLYKAPGGSNDDWFWLHAALWCGRNTLVLTNDEMRDHHFQMLSHRAFVSWKERSQMHFDFSTEWCAKDGCNGDMRRPLLLTLPDIYSRRIQRLGVNSLVIPLAKRGDCNRFLDGSHDADDNAPFDETYVCINLKEDS